MSDLSRRRRARRWQPKPTKIIIGFCCNDSDNGLFEEQCHAISFPAGFLELETHWRGRRFRVEGDAIVLSGKRWPVIGSKEWYGNWCWDAYYMRPDIAAAFLLWLRRRKLFQVDSGWSQIFDWYKGNGPELPIEILEARLIEAQREHRY